MAMTYIKIYRELLDSQCFAHPTTLKIWIWLLLKASYKDRFISIKTGNGFTEVELKRGQMLFGRMKAEDALGIDGSTIYKHIQKLDAWGQISCKSNNQYTIITICNYETYQGDEIIKEQPSNSGVTAEEQPSNSGVTQTITVKESKEGKECITQNVNFKVTEPKMWNTLLKHFGIESELNYISKHKEINFFLNTLLKENMLAHFKNQFRHYWHYCKERPAFKQGFVRFIHQAGWNDESWEQKVKDLKEQKKKDYTPIDASKWHLQDNF